MMKSLTSDRTAIRFNGWTLYPAAGELERDGKRQRLQDLPLQILIELLNRPGEMVAREQLTAKLWPHGVVEFETGLNTAVSKLRSALGDNAETPIYIETVPRKGYRFIGTISHEPAPAPQTIEPVPARSKGRRVAALAGAALFLIVAALALFNAYTLKPPLHIRLAVLPFENLSADSANAFFADGMHGEILSALTDRAPQMDVISRTTMMTYRGRPKTVSEIAKELNVTHILEGAVRREGQAVRVTLQLIDAHNDDHIWSNSYDRQLTDVMKLQAQVAQEIATQLSLKLSPPDADLPASSNPEAYDLYLRAKLVVPLIGQWTSPATIAETEQWLDRAVELDSTFAAAYIQRAQLKIIKYVVNVDLSEANVQSAQADIGAARRLAGDHAEVLQVDSRHAAMQGNWSKAGPLLERPQMIASRNPTVMRWRAFALCHQDRLNEGLQLFAEIDQLDPRNSANIYSWSHELWNARRGVEALRVIQDFNRRGGDRFEYGDLVFAFTGDSQPLRNDVEHMSHLVDPDTRLAANYDLLRYERRFSELVPLLQDGRDENGGDIPTIRLRSFRSPTSPGVGSKPLADLYGWAKLLNGDPAAAMSDGRTLLQFAAMPVSSNRNGVGYLRILKAEGELFLGNRTQAVTDARAALAMFSRDQDNPRRFAASQVAKILAWAGAEDDAVTLLEELATEFPALGPAEVTRDPLYSIPLGKHARYRELEKKLESEIAANRGSFNQNADHVQR